MEPVATSSNTFDPNRAEAFGETLLAAFNAAALSLMVSVGHRTGLFDAMSQLEWATAEELAARAGLNERYVREWLGAMATAKVASVDNHERFHLPAEHAACLTRAAGTNNMAVYAQYIGQLGSVEDEIVECFRHGGGVPYARYRRFHEIMAEDSSQTVLPALESHILELVPGVATRLADGIDVLDAGCGRGMAIMTLAARFPASRFTGIDLSEDAIAWAREEAARRGLRNVTFVQADLTGFDREAVPDQYDLAFTFDAVHDQAKPLNVMKGIRRSLRPGGAWIMQDIHGHSHVHQNLEHPMGTLLYTISCMHCTSVSLAQGGDGLGAMWGREIAESMLRDAGFQAVNVHRLDHDPQNDWYVMRV